VAQPFLAVLLGYSSPAAGFSSLRPPRSYLCALCVKSLSPLLSPSLTSFCLDKPIHISDTPPIENYAPGNLFLPIACIQILSRESNIAMQLLLVGVITTLCTVLVHSLIPLMIVKGVRLHLARGRAGVWVWDVVLVLNFTLLTLVAHFIEIALWALSFVLCGEFSNFTAALFYSGNTYTTLGDSTTVLSARWRMLAPIEAANGMLMFGVTTAIIFTVIHRLVEAKFGLQRDPPPKIR